MAEGARDLVGFVERAEGVQEFWVIAEGEHRRLAADDDERVVVVVVHVLRGRSVLDQFHVLRCVQEPHRDQVID